MPNTIFVGNGVNRLGHAASWKDVLRRLAGYVGKTDLILRGIENKPFTLVFEEIYLRSARARGTKEIDLKREAAGLIDAIPNNECHRRLLNIGTRHIITTNYDYNLESSAHSQHRAASLRRETKYSLFRRRSVGSQFLWHIHGESRSPNSLALGHDHYSGSLHHIRDYLVTRSARSKVKASPFMSGIRDFDSSYGEYSWLDVFLRDDIHIIGFSMDYTEIELWWLLSFKARQSLKGLKVGETIYYYREPRRPDPRLSAKLAILQSFGVVPRRLSGDSYEEGYSAFADSFV